ncbi:MAG: hypothetical protein HY360_05225 [Verrucomicrobia bacterium]|nr:hypothetical protein [Verrucomicrobiota bacterium]
MKTQLVGDEEVSFPYRVPSNYDPKGKEVHRVLLNCVWQTSEFDSWADDRGIFIVHLKFKSGGCWKVEDGYGRAILDGLAQLKKQYRVATDQLLVYGASRGGQLSSFFTAWKPELVTAWVAQVPGVLPKADVRWKYLTGIVTVGEGDDGRYQLGARFMAEARKLQLPVLWRSYANTGHEVPPGSMALSMAFFAHHHARTQAMLAKGRSGGGSSHADSATPPKYIGDAQEWKYYAAESEEAKAIAEEHRVELPSEAIAKAWAEPEEMKAAAAIDEDKKLRKRCEW